ncbi:conserved hypothetical protein [Tenacibaculum maritimum]|uniref:hypothetical protein n=1 Tax=Tenacibaculum maritimum TaxID=107401 RepID=UPI0012E6172F|nr:hypothetical protein [Tenacibaculum maritimum]CAA0251159.1 conserved hypothetical protein [Tenacibaculum maritimum]CAA0252286.1 conserved hypothetical protein [Tenacibaculum maritimum]
MNDFIDETYKRVEKIIYYKHLNIKSFEENIKVSNNSIRIAIRKGSSFKSNVLNKILNRFPEINPTWLLTGKEEMLIEDLTEEKLAEEKKLQYKKQMKENMLNLFLEDKEIQEALSVILEKNVAQEEE